VPQVVTEVVVDRSIDEVFAFVTDPRNDPRWWRGVREVRIVTRPADPDDPVGTEYEQVTQLFGRQFVGRIRLTEHDPPHRATLTSVQSATPFVAIYTFEPMGAERARFRMTATVAVVGPYRLLGPLFLALIRRQTRIYFGVLKQVLEGRVS
jgi:uncharacterized protein YndB with AHSA1/START domain